MTVYLDRSFPKNIKLQEQKHPLCNGNFFKLLEASELMTEKNGWQPIFFYKQDNALLASFIKGHSYGEYIFDWAWADFYHQHQIPYYPKLLHALPFTPVNAPKVLGPNLEDRKELMKTSFDFYQQQDQLSGEHYLFSSAEENQDLERLGFSIMETHQYHWHNRYQSFEHYLQCLSKNRKKMIKKERRKVEESDLEIKRLQGSELDQDLLEQVYQLYLTTIDKKQSLAYLNEAFFLNLKEYMAESTMLIAAFRRDELVAMSLFFLGENALYGRYWGIKKEEQKSYPNLHFELCYYQGMEYCIEKKIPLFEAGAQGEHKLWRGFEPVKIYSAHHLKHPIFFQAVKQYIAKQNQENNFRLQHLKQYLPFKNL